MDSSPYDENNVDKNDDGREDEAGNKRKNPSEDSSLPKKSKQKTNVVNTRSWVWEHFSRLKDNKDKCICLYCTKELGCRTANGTSVLTNHLRICKEHNAWLETQDQTQSVLNPHGDGGNVRLCKVSESVFREATNELVVLAELPLSFVDSLAWKHFCNKTKLYKPHSRRTLTRDVVEIYSMKKARMMDLISSNNQRVSLTTGIWVAPTTSSSYMVITAHFIDARWKLQKLVISFKNICDHKGKTISDVLLESMVEWGIKKVFTITVDNATANTNALKLFSDAFSLEGNHSLVLGGQMLHLRCAAHIINLVVQDGLKIIDNSVAAVRNSVHYVRASSHRVDAFNKRVETGKMTRGSLPLDCQTRWNSTYLMLSRAIKFRIPFEKMVIEDKLFNDYFAEKVDGHGTTKRIGPSISHDWDECERLVKFLGIFYNATLMVSASTTVNSYNCFGEIVTIQKNLKTLCNSGDPKLKAMAVLMRSKFEKYWGDLKQINKLLIIASVFDPRKKMKYANLCFEMLFGKDSAEAKKNYDAVFACLENLYEEYCINYNIVGSSKSGSSQSQNQSQSGSSQSQKDNVFEDMDLDNGVEYERVDTVYKEWVNEVGFEDATSELELYLAEKLENPKENPLGIQFSVIGWWKMNSTKYPILASLAKDVLAMQISSVAAESAFSNSNRVLDPSRSCLTHYMIEVLMCTEQWLKCEIHINEKGLITNQEILANIELQDELQREFEAQCNLRE